MPIENDQANNKFYVDTVVESATAGDKALTKIQDGSFSAAGGIDMSGNSITGLPNSTDRDAAANKNYVDNGGTIAKILMASLPRSPIDFNGCTLKNISDRTDRRDAANKAYVDNKVSLPSLIGPKPIITVWAEGKGPLGEGHYEFSFGNVGSGSEHAYGGYYMSAPGGIIRGSLTVTESMVILSEDVKVNIVVNGIEQVNHFMVRKIWRNLQLRNFPRPNRIKPMRCYKILFQEPPILKYQTRTYLF